MRTLNLGLWGLEVPVIAVGCWRIDGIDAKAANHFIHAALDLGANFFDKAAEVRLSHDDWYAIYLAAGNILP